MRKLFYSITDRIDRLLSPLFSRNTGTQRFVVFTSGRSGSNFFLSVINQHPDIYCFSELFHPERIWIGEDCESAFLHKPVAFRLREFFPRLFMVGVWRSSRSKVCTGFKYIWFHTPRIRETVLLNPRVKKVLLTRRNILRTEVSRQIADKTNEWIKFDDTTQCNRIQFDLVQFWRHFEKTNGQIGKLKESLLERGQDHLEIFFEELTNESRDSVLKEFCDYLGVKQWEFKFADVKIKRQNPFTLRELLVNFEEVERGLTGTSAEWMLTDE